MNITVYSEVDSIKEVCLAVYGSCTECIKECIEERLKNFQSTEYSTSLDINMLKPMVEKVLSIAFPLLSIIGIIGNIIVIFVILRLKEMRKSCTNLFLLNMAIADLAVSIFCVNLTLIEYVNGFIVQQLGVIFCRLNFFLQSTSYAASVLLLFMLSIERYIVIIFPMKVHRMLSKKIYMVLLTIIWIISITIGMPNIFIYTSSNSTLCHSTNLIRKKYFHLAQFLTLYLLPLIIMIFLYAHISYRLTKSFKLIQSNINMSMNDLDKVYRRASNSELNCQTCQGNVQRRSMPSIAMLRRRRSSGSSLTDRKRVIKMLIVILILFTLSRLPRHVWGFIYFSRIKSLTSIEFGIIFPPISFFCYYLTSALNPLVYFVFSASLRDSASLALSCFRPFHRTSYSNPKIFKSNIICDTGNTEK